jgi:hypothetical protein
MVYSKMIYILSQWAVQNKDCEDCLFMCRLSLSVSNVFAVEFHACKILRAGSAQLAEHCSSPLTQHRQLKSGCQLCRSRRQEIPYSWTEKY